MSKPKYKLIIIVDIPLAMSGVGTQFKYIIDGLVNSKDNDFDITVFGGAVRHQKYEPFKVEEWGENVKIIPVDGYGNPDILRQALDFEKPDALWMITDPRFFDWLFQMSSEIHQFCPIIYWNLWDHADKETWPRYNSFYYNACDKLPAINKMTYNFLKENGWANKTSYLPHGVPESDFKIISKEEVKKAKKAHLGEDKEDAFVLFYNSRNALRKRTGNVVMAFKRFLDMLPEEERENCMMAMKSSPKDPEGQELNVIVRDLDLVGKIAFADSKFTNDKMAEFYNMADVTISLSSEEGFGLSVLESLMCGTPVICTKTGGMQDQIIDPETKEEFGFALEPEAQSLIGSQSTPYILSDHVNFNTAAQKIYEIYRRFKMNGDHKEYWAGERARESMLRRFSLEDMQARMEKVIVEAIKEYKNKQKEDKQFRMVEL